MELKYPANGQRSRRGTTQPGSEQSLSEGAGKPKRMDKEWTDVFFWMATVVAGLIAAAVFAVYLFSETGKRTGCNRPSSVCWSYLANRMGS
jgi:hypothetical protein